MEEGRVAGKTYEQRFAAAIQRAADLGDETLVSWFDGGAGETNVVAQRLDEEGAWRSGIQDFHAWVLRDPVGLLLGEDRFGAALEIGYGGGRLLRAASQLFDNVFGVDVHTQTERVGKLLQERGATNFELFATDGKSLPIDSGRVDLVYSFVVLLHLSGPDVFETYLKEAHRVLKPGGIASLYYGRPYSYRTQTATNALARAVYAVAEPLAELLLLDLLGTGYRTLEGEPNAVTLTVSRRRARALARRCGFVVEHHQSHPRLKQGFLVLRKP
jgi:SAM-dependent methyltransferase